MPRINKIVLNDPIWERQRGETMKAFAAFKLYRDSKPKDRSLREVAERLGLKSFKGCGDWSVKYSWVARCEAFDAAEDKKYLQLQLEQTKKMVERQAKDAETFQKVLMQPVSAYLKRLQADIDDKVKNFDNITTRELYNLILRSAGAYGDLVNVERKSRGEPTDIYFHDIDFSKLTDEELEKVSRTGKI